MFISTIIYSPTYIYNRIIIWIPVIITDRIKMSLPSDSRMTNGYYLMKES